MELETSNETLQPMMQSGDVQPQMTTTPIGLTALTSVIQERQVLEQHIETRTTTLLQQEVAWLEGKRIMTCDNFIKILSTLINVFANRVICQIQPNGS